MYDSLKYPIIMIMIRILITLVGLSCAALTVMADDAASGSVVVEFLEYRFANNVALLDAEAEYGTRANRAVFKLVTLLTNAVMVT